MRRTLIALLLLAASLVVAGAEPVGATTRSVANEAQYRAALAALSADTTGAHTIRLSADITLNDGSDPTYTGSQPLTIDGDGHTIDAGGTSRILARPGNGPDITVTEAVLTGGSAGTGAGGALWSENGVLWVVASTLEGNSAGLGGAVSAGDGVAYLTNSTVTGNHATWEGGGVAGGGIGLWHTTLASNASTGGPANLWTMGVLTGFGSVVADPIGGPNCGIALNLSEGRNYATDASCGYGATGDVQNGADPGLGPLTDNGGPTPTRLPRLGSPLVNAIPFASCSGTVTSDQRGTPRPFPPGGGCDIGAVERTSEANLTVGDEAQYRAALNEASWDGGRAHTITLGADLTLDDSTDPTYTGTQALTIDGDGHTIDAGGTSRALAVQAPATTELVDLTIREGHAGDVGGGVYSNGPLTITRSTLTANHATLDGGGVFVSFAPLTVVDSTFTGNSAGVRAGGARSSGATVTIEASTFAGNSSPVGANVRGGALVLTASAFADPAGGGANCSLDSEGTTTSNGHNWADDASCGLTGTGDVQDPGGDPRLGALRDNGGPTPTMFPLWGSPLRDAIPGAAAGTDQRGVARPYPAGGATDIGAVEGVYPPHAFRDVPPWVDSAVRWITSTVNDPQLMTGITPTTFRPNDNITRGQFVRLLYREAGAPDVSGLAPHGYTDVPAWIESAVRWAKANNIMTGTTPTRFSPNTPATRSVVVVAKYRFAGSQDIGGFAPNPFTDVPTTLDTPVTWAFHHQLMTGITATTFRPNASITRGQLARVDERLGLSPWAWADPDLAPPTLPFRPDSF